MSLQHLSTDSITEKELQRLATDSVAESKTLEYKEALVLATDEQKREFLSDVTALGNTDGGDLLLGMKADKGIATEIVGLKGFVADDSIGKIENLLRDSIQPRLMGVQFRSIALQNGNHALLVRIPRSFAAPHMVRHQGVTRFCGRNSNGKYDLDVHELRSTFLASETLSERLRNHRIDRVNKIVSGNTPVPLDGDSFLVLHLLPVIGARSDSKLSTQDLHAVRNSSELKPLASRGWGGTFNFEGIIVKSSAGSGKYDSYVQLSRNGFIEAVNSQVIRPRQTRIASKETHKLLPSVYWEKEVIDSLGSYLKALTLLQISPPFYLSLSLLNVKGYYMGVDNDYGSFEARPIPDDHLLTDEILVESTQQLPAAILRPLFDQVWNACGYPQSRNYKSDGTWGES